MNTDEYHNMEAMEKFKEYVKIALCGIGSVTVITVAWIIRNMKQMDVESEMPSEYWISKKAESEAEVEKYRISEESRVQLLMDERNRRQQLALDERQRADDERASKREFELHAPEEYWAHKAMVEKEKTAREEEKTKREHEKTRREFFKN